MSQAIVIGGYTEDSPLEMSYIGITDITGWWNEDSGEITATGTVRISPIRDVFLPLPVMGNFWAESSIPGLKTGTENSQNLHDLSIDKELNLVNLNVIAD